MIAKIDQWSSFDAGRAILHKSCFLIWFHLLFTKQSLSSKSIFLILIWNMCITDMGGLICNGHDCNQGYQNLSRNFRTIPITKKHWVHICASNLALRIVALGQTRTFHIVITRQLGGVSWKSRANFRTIWFNRLKSWTTYIAGRIRKRTYVQSNKSSQIQRWLSFWTWATV